MRFGFLCGLLNDVHAKHHSWRQRCGCKYANAMHYPEAPDRDEDLLAKLADDAPGYFAQLARANGDITRMRVHDKTVYFLNHPDCARDLLVNKQRHVRKGQGMEDGSVLGREVPPVDAEAHTRSRAMTQNAFNRTRVNGYDEVLVACALEVCERWSALGEGTSIDMQDEMERLTLRIAGRVLFGADVPDDVAHAFHLMVTESHPLASVFGDLMPFLTFVSNPLAAQATRTVQAWVDGLIDERWSASPPPTSHGDVPPSQGGGELWNDTLSMLLAYQRANPNITDAQLSEEAMRLFVVTPETSCSTLTWTWYLLAQYPHKAAKLRDEIDRICGEQLPTADDLAHLPYTRAVITESMRLYPPAWVIGRAITSNTTLGAYALPAGSAALVSQWVLHRDARYWPNAESFEPERWLADDPSRPKFAYFPFGAGAHACLGEDFAWVEIQLALAVLAQRWLRVLCEDARVATRTLVALRARHGLKMRLTRSKLERGVAV